MPAGIRWEMDTGMGGFVGRIERLWWCWYCVGVSGLVFTETVPSIARPPYVASRAHSDVCRVTRWIALLSIPSRCVDVRTGLESLSPHHHITINSITALLSLYHHHHLLIMLPVPRVCVMFLLRKSRFVPLYLYRPMCHYPGRNKVPDVCFPPVRRMAIIFVSRRLLSGLAYSVAGHFRAKIAGKSALCVRHTTFLPVLWAVFGGLWAVFGGLWGVFRGVSGRYRPFPGVFQVLWVVLPVGRDGKTAI